MHLFSEIEMKMLLTNGCICITGENGSSVNVTLHLSGVVIALRMNFTLTLRDLSFHFLIVESSDDVNMKLSPRTHECVIGALCWDYNLTLDLRSFFERIFIVPSLATVNKFQCSFLSCSP